MGTAALAERVRSGDPSAFAEMYEEFAEPIVGLCIVLLRDREDAADAMQDTFVLAAQRIDQLRDVERLRPWLFAIARHVCFRRMAQRRRTTPVAAVPDISLADEDDLTARLAAADTAALVWSAASGLNERDRAVLYLSTGQGLEGEELAAALGVHHANPYSLLNRAKRQLQRAIGVLLVARSGRRECGSLAEMLKAWDGALTPLLRKRVGRHIDRCSTCQTTRSRALVASAIEAVPAVVANTSDAISAALPADQLYDIAAHRPVPTERWQRDGFPLATDARSRSRRLSLAAVLVLVFATSLGVFTFGRRHSSRPVTTQQPVVDLRAPVAIHPTMSTPTATSSPPSSEQKVLTPPPAPARTPEPTDTVPGWLPTPRGDPPALPPTTDAPKPPPTTTPITATPSTAVPKTTTTRPPTTSTTTTTVVS